MTLRGDWMEDLPIERAVPPDGGTWSCMILQIPPYRTTLDFPFTGPRNLRATYMVRDTSQEADHAEALFHIRKTGALITILRGLSFVT